MTGWMFSYSIDYLEAFTSKLICKRGLAMNVERVISYYAERIRGRDKRAAINLKRPVKIGKKRIRDAYAQRDRDIAKDVVVRLFVGAKRAGVNG